MKNKNVNKSFSGRLKMNQSEKQTIYRSFALSGSIILSSVCSLGSFARSRVLPLVLKSENNTIMATHALQPWKVVLQIACEERNPAKIDRLLSILTLVSPDPATSTAPDTRRPGITLSAPFGRTPGKWDSPAHSSSQNIFLLHVKESVAIHLCDFFLMALGGCFTHVLFWQLLLLSSACQRSIGLIKEGRDMLWQGEPAEVLRRLGQLRLASTLNPEEIALYQVILGAMEHFPEVGRMYYHLNIEKALDRLSMYFQELDRQGSLHIPDPHFSAQAFLTLLQGQIIERARLGAGPAPTSEEIERHIDACVTFFLAAHHVNRPD